MDIKETDILGDKIINHWYYRSKAKAVMHFLGAVDGKTILDIGAGSGFFSQYLLSQTKAKVAWCVDICYENDSDFLMEEKLIHFRRSIDTVNANVVLFMDVLEHVDDDIGLLTSYIHKVPKNAKFLISVPAFQFLWSGHDVFLEHKRRYRLKEIENIAQRAGLTVKKSAYYFASILPIAAALRIAEKICSRNDRPARSQLKQHHLWVNETLAALCTIERYILKYNRLAGLTIFCLAENIQQHSNTASGST